MFPFKRFVVKGHSMQPLFNPGDRVIINRWAYLFSPPKPGDLVAFWLQDESSDILLKRIKTISGNRVFVIGSNPNDSLDSSSFGAVSKNKVIGKFLTKY